MSVSAAVTMTCCRPALHQHPGHDHRKRKIFICFDVMQDAYTLDGLDPEGEFTAWCLNHRITARDIQHQARTYRHSTPNIFQPLCMLQGCFPASWDTRPLVLWRVLAMA
jgi:hypothetical protein